MRYLNEDQVSDLVRHLREVADDDPECTWAPPIREKVRLLFPEVCNHTEFGAWLTTHWCKYDTFPDYEDWRVLEESLNNSYELLKPKEITITADVLQSWIDRLDQFETDVNQSQGLLLDEMKKVLDDNT